MLEAIAGNLWLLLTVIIPGLFTYGVWRVLLLLEPSKRLTADALNQIDDSVLTTTCIIVALALLQQAIAIAVEFGLDRLARVRKNKWPHFYSLFCERFRLASEGKLNENATRIIGNLFLSLNISIGLVMLLLYFLAYESMTPVHWVPLVLMVLFVFTVISAIFRMLNAKSIIKESKKSKRKNNSSA